MKTQVNVKIDTKVKKAAQKKASAIGLSLSSVVNATLKQFAHTGELHLSSEYTMTPYLEELIKEALVEYKTGKTKHFESADALLQHLNK